MSFSGIKQTNIKRYSRWVLLLFVASWTNLIVQAPLHTDMKVQIALSSHMDTVHCNCSESLCDTVLNLEQQSADVVHLIFDGMYGFQLAFSLSIANPHQQTIILQDIKYRMMAFEENRPPPLDITSILLI